MNSRVDYGADKFVGVTEAQGLVVSGLEGAEIKATHVCWKDPAFALHTHTDRAEGYTVFLLRHDLKAHPAWTDERPTPHNTIHRGQFLLLDMREVHTALVSGDVDCMTLYTSSDSLRRFQEEHDLRPTGLLQAQPSVVHEDAVVRDLSGALFPALTQAQEAGQLYVDHVALALMARLSSQFSTHPMTIRLPKGGLAPWQERRAKEMLTAYLDGRMGLEALAAECRLSRAHFARAFKVSTGMSPMRWLNTQRIERVKMLLLDTNQTLETIAATCGFTDASHLTRSFMQVTGMPPGAWRRLRRS